MATFRACFVPLSTLETRANTGSTLEVVDPSLVTRLTNLTTSGSSQNVQENATDFVAPANGLIYGSCDGAVDVLTGDDPTAAATAGIPLLASVQFAFAISSGHKLAVKDA